MSAAVPPTTKTNTDAGPGTGSAPVTPAPATGASSSAGSLAALPRLLRSDPVLGVLIGAADGTVAVPEAAQAVVAAALAAFTERTPLLVVTATGLDAERLGDDLACLIAPEGDESEEPDDGPVVGALAGPVTVLPAWETLPFERVSPETETMGRRLAVLHALTATPDPGAPATAPGDRGPGPGPPAAAGPLGGHGASGHPPRPAGRRGGVTAPAGGHGLPARAPGGAPG